MRKDRQLIVDYLAAGDWPSVVLNRPGRKGNTHRPRHHRARVELFVGHRQAMMNGFGVNAREQQDTLELLSALKGVQLQPAPVPGV